MSFGAIKPNGGNGGKGFINPIEQAVIFSESNLIRTVTQASDSTSKGTFIAGVRLTGPASGREIIAYFGNAAGSGNMLVIERNVDKIRVFMDAGIARFYETVHLFRDNSHFRLRVEVDTPNADPDERIRIFKNNERLAVTGITALQNHAFPMGVNDKQEVGSIVNSNKLNNTILSDVHWYDNKIINDDTDEFPFGNHSITFAKPPSDQDHGTNGYHLTFGNAADYGEDSSANGNDFTGSGFDPDSQVLDIPGNSYPILNHLDGLEYLVLANGGTEWSRNSTTWRSTRCSTPIPSTGKWYFEATFNDVTYSAIGLATPDSPLSGNVGQYDNSWGIYSKSTIEWIKYHSNVGEKGFITPAPVNGDTVQICVDSDAGKVWFGVNNNFDGDPAAGTSESYSGLPEVVIPMVSAYNQSANQINFGQRPFAYTPPEDFLSMQAANLPTPAFNGRDKFAANTRVGTGAEATIVTPFDKTGLLWVKDRSSGRSHQLYDSLRGATKYVSSDSTAAESTSAQGVKSFDTGSITIGDLSGLNNNTETFVDWIFGNDGTEVLNTDGTIDSQVIADSSGYMSIVTLTGNQTDNETFGHGLGRVPEMVIGKSLASGMHWPVWHKGLTSDRHGIFLNSNVGENNPSSDYWRPELATSSVMGLGPNDDANDNGQTMLFYCFASIPGLVKVFSYEGDGSNDGPLVDCRFKPRWILGKRRDGTGNWFIVDTARDPENAVEHFLYPADPANEDTGAFFDILSCGFKLRGNSAFLNANGNTYIGLAIADIAGGGDLPAILGN